MQLSTTNNKGGYAFLPWLDKTFRRQAQNEMRFSQFAKVKQAFGLRRGKTMNFDRIGRVNTAGTSLTETTRVPKTDFNLDQGTLTIGEWGNAIPLTSFVEDIAEISLKTEGMAELRDDAARAKDLAIEAEMDNCPVRYVPLGTASGSFSSDGTATGTAASKINSYHVRKIIDELKRRNCPPLKGGDFWAICSVMGANGIYEDIETLTQYTTLDNAAKGEIGRYYKTRFVTETNALTESIGTSAADVGECYFFGLDGGVLEAVVRPMALRYQEEDFGREQYVAWLETVGYACIWPASATIQQVRCIKVDSE